MSYFKHRLLNLHIHKLLTLSINQLLYTKIATKCKTCCLLNSSFINVDSKVYRHIFSCFHCLIAKLGEDSIIVFAFLISAAFMSRSSFDRNASL